MRGIKFRVWDKEMQSFDANRDINIYSSFPDKVKHITWLISAIAMSGIDIQQFTGLKDKNGKEIYEGDIIEWFADSLYKKAIVKWKDNGGYYAERIDKKLVYDSEREFDFQSFIPINYGNFDGEVIGNIYENPNFAIEGFSEQESGK